MEKKKKTWSEPKLTALVRRKPEEGILVVCKVVHGVEGPDLRAGGCNIRCAVGCEDWGGGT
jgi:hypothetical protein